jgi:hypothetical protein
MPYSTPEQRRFPPLPGYTVRADFDGGALSSDFGALLLRGIDRQSGLTERLAAAVHDKRHPSYTDHPLRDLFAQRIYQLASGYADGNDANSLRHDPLFTLSVERVPLEPTQDLASAPTFSRLEHSVDRKDIYRLTQAFVDHFIASYPEPPAAIVLDLDHSEDQPMASRNSPSLTIIPRAIASYRCLFSKGPRTPWSPPASDRGSAPQARKMRGSWFASCPLSGAIGP